jgi:hypothetical protein
VNRRYLTIMTIDDHRTAACEWATVHRCVDELENIIRSGRRVPDTLHTNVKRIHRDLGRIRREMQEVQACTLPGDHEGDDCWQEIKTVNPAAVAWRSTAVLTLEDHITAARALGPSQPAIHRFLDIISNRRHLPVRILDWAIRIIHLIQIVRCEMEDVQFTTIRGRDRWVNYWLGSSNCFDGNEGGDKSSEEQK